MKNNQHLKMVRFLI